MERYEIEGELNGCKQILQNTDYFILKAIEEILGADLSMTCSKSS